MVIENGGRDREAFAPLARSIARSLTRRRPDKLDAAAFLRPSLV